MGKDRLAHISSPARGYLADNLGNLGFNVMGDGIFHISTYIFTTTGMVILQSKALKPHDPRPGNMLIGTIVTGFGIFNLLKGFIDHQLLGIHHVNEIVPPGQWTFWEMGFLLGETAPLLAGGWLLWQAESARLSRRPLERYNSFSSCSLQQGEHADTYIYQWNWLKGKE